MAISYLFFIKNLVNFTYSIRLSETCCQIWHWSCLWSSAVSRNATSISSMFGKDSTNNNLDMAIKGQMLQKLYIGPTMFIFYSIWNLLLLICIQFKPSESIGVIWCIIQNRINNNWDVVIKVLVLKNINLLQHLKFITGVKIP